MFWYFGFYLIYSKYIAINPFKIIEFYKLEHLDNNNEYQNFKAYKLLSTVNESGCLHGAVKRLNENNNFKRDHKFLLRDSDIENQIAEKFKQSISDFLVN